MMVKKKNNQFCSAPHDYIVNLADKQLLSEKLSGTSADSIPKEAEPPMTSGDLLELSTSQLVDAHAVITTTDGPNRK